MVPNDWLAQTLGMGSDVHVRKPVGQRRTRDTGKAAELLPTQLGKVNSKARPGLIPLGGLRYASGLKE